jgi:hypothetical protein
MIAMTSTTGAMGATVCLGDRNFLGTREEHLHALCLAVFLPIIGKISQGRVSDTSSEGG